MASQLEMDCYHKADPAEGKFTLIGRDRTAPLFVRMWASIRTGNVADAAKYFAEVAAISEAHYMFNPTEREQVDNAIEIADKMENWRSQNR